MKTNLSTFPEYKRPKGEPIEVYWARHIDMVLVWKENFTKELEQIREQCEQDQELGMYAFIEEILGQ